MTVSRSHDYREILKGIPFFASFNDEELGMVGQIIRRKEYRKNAVILQDEETRYYMYIILTGKVKVLQASADGKEQILAIHKKRDFFGEMSLLDGKTLPATVVAMEDTTVGLIAREDFDRFFLNNPNVLKQLIVLLCQRLRESWLMLRVLSFADAENRVRAVLTHVSSTTGVNDMRGVLIPMKLTHREIADYAALARETVSRLLSRFSQSGEIEILENKNILLKPSFVKKTGQL